ncbi:MAG: FIST C-terminal domain-containing protein [Pseudomonadales bacterium]|nr:FIST C-terminal domain-containing protein [Pseudomonadales bacterium]
MEINVVSSTAMDTPTALKEIIGKVNGIVPSLVIAAFNTELDGELISSELNAIFDCPIIGSSSCKGALTITASDANASASLALFLINDPKGNYGVGHRELGEDPKTSAMEALDMALYASDRGYESPTLIWCMLPPGAEESILEGFSEVVGSNVPVFGGSSADNDVSGQWQQLTDVSAGTNQICVAVLYPSTAPGISFSSGYEPTETTLTVTSCEGRLLKTLDNVTAANRYDEIIKGTITPYLSGGNILALTTLHPFGRKITTADGIEDYLLSHPDAINEYGELSLFSKIEEGEHLFLMQGSRQNLLRRANRVIKNATELLPEGAKPKGILMIYCAGCMLTIEDELAIMLEALQQENQGIPIFAIYTFGEQGCFLDGQNRHGNLMISAVAFD